MPTTLPLDDLTQIRRTRDIAEALRRSRRVTLRRIILTRIALWWCERELRRLQRRTLR